MNVSSSQQHNAFLTSVHERLEAVEQTWRALRELCLLTQAEELELRGTLGRFEQSVCELKQLATLAAQERDQLQRDKTALTTQVAASERERRKLLGYHSALQHRVDELYGINAALALRIGELQRDNQQYTQRIAMLEAYTRQ